MQKTSTGKPYLKNRYKGGHIVTKSVGNRKLRISQCCSIYSQSLFWR